MKCKNYLLILLVLSAPFTRGHTDVATNDVYNVDYGNIDIYKKSLSREYNKPVEVIRYRELDEEVKKVSNAVLTALGKNKYTDLKGYVTQSFRDIVDLDEMESQHRDHPKGEYRIDFILGVPDEKVVYMRISQVITGEDGSVTNTIGRITLEKLDSKWILTAF